jgi:lariat debranching enzyme
MGLLQNLKPQWWFAAHLHARYEATYVHPSSGPPYQDQAPPSQPVQNPDEISIEDDEDFDEVPTTSSSNPAPTIPSNNPDEILLDDEEPGVEAPPPAPVPPVLTRFLALDKCLPQRQFLEVIDVDVPSPNTNPLFSFDPEWLAIDRAFQPWFSTVPRQREFPDEQEARALVSKELEWVNANIKKDENGVIPLDDWQTFAQTAPGPGSEGANKHHQRELGFARLYLQLLMEVFSAKIHQSTNCCVLQDARYTGQNQLVGASDASNECVGFAFVPTVLL